jgi:hypothetical protein
METKKRGTSIKSLMQNDNNYVDTQPVAKKRNIKNLVDNINKDLDNYSVNNTLDTESDKETETETKTKTGIGKYISMPYFLKEILMISIIYVLMSQKFLQNFIAGYIQYATSESFIGTFILGLILGLLFIIIRKIENVI